MRIVEIKPLSNGAHRNQDSTFDILPDGWAIIPKDMELANFPFGDVTVDEIDNIMTVTSWTPGIIPDPDPEPEKQPSAIDDIESLVVDHEYRLTLLELGLTE